MINALLEHVPIKMEVKDNEEEAKRNDLAKDDMAMEMAIDDDKIDETDEELEEDEEDDEEEEESDTESDALEIEQAAVMLMSSDEEAELEAQRIRFPDITNTKKSSKDSLKSSRSSSRNSQSSNSSSKPQFTKESSPIKESLEELHKKQRISPRLKNSENNKTLDSLNKENDNNNSNKLSTQILAKAKTDQQKLENNKTLELNKNKQDDTSKSLDNNKNSENNRNKENLPKSPANQAGSKSRRGSDNSTCSVASTVASDSAETESCGNIYVFNLQQKLIFNCEFCDIKYGDLENFGRHLHETHKLFHLDEDPEKENAPRNLSKTINLSKNKTSKSSATNVKKEPLACFDTLAEPPVALPPSVLAEPLDSCGNVFMLNHRKLFLVCGYCECKYANLDLFEKHLRQQHRIFEGCRNEVNVVPKVEVMEEVFIITEMVDKPDNIPPQVMVAIPAEIPLDISINQENSTETPGNAEDTMETVEEVSNLEPTETASELDTNILETSLIKEPEMPILISKVSDAKGIEIISEIVVTEKTSIKKTRSKRRSSPEKPLESPSKRPKRITRNNTKVEEKPPLASIEENPSEKTPESEQISKAVTISDISKSAETKEVTKSTKPTESQKDPLLEVVETQETKETAKPTDSKITTPLKTYETRETRKSAQIKKLTNTEETKETKQQPTKTKENITKPKTRKDSKIAETPRTKSTRNSTKSSETNHFETEKSDVVRKPEIKTKTGKKSKLKCSTCSKQFKRSDTLKTHERTHAAERAFVCDVCNKSFKAQTNLYMHKRFHLGDAYKNYKCQFCEKKFFRNTDRKVHELTHTGEKRFECGICDRGFVSQSNIKKHMEKNHGKDAEANIKKIPQEKVEEAVQKTTINEDDHNMDDLSTDPVEDIIKQLQNEMQPRHDPESNAVTFTINTLACSEDLNKTLEITNQQNDEIDTTEKDVKPTLLQIVKRFMCDLCNRTFEKHIRLVEHRRLHTGEKPFGCDICGKHFRIRMRLNEHKQRHSSEKKFKCEICQLACCTKQDLNLHMRHHTNDRRYQCNMCPKAFVRSSDLKIHVRIHTGEKPYVCDICHKCFRANQNLSVHKKSHMGEASKTYKCEHCEKKFMRNIDRKVHMRSHTGEKPFKCEICNKGYSSKFNVRTHIERDHVSANGVGPPPRGKKKPGPKPKALRAELEKQKQLIQELQNQLLQQIKTDEKVIYAEDDLLTEHNTLEATSSLLSSSSKTDPIQSAYELLDKLKSSATTTSKPLTIIPSPPPLAEPNSDPFTKAKKDSPNVLPLSITQKLEQHSPLPSSTSSSTSCLTTPSPPKTTATKVVSQKTSLGIQQVSVTVSMQVENVPAEPTTSEKENAGILTSSSSSTASVKKERKITSYFTVVGQKGEV